MQNTLIINGAEKTFSEGQMPKTLAEVLNHLKINHATVVAEIDGKIIERKQFAETKVSPKQSIELVRFVGGG